MMVFLQYCKEYSGQRKIIMSDRDLAKYWYLVWSKCTKHCNKWPNIPVL